jgi:Protein of unknown function (DUF2934)
MGYPTDEQIRTRAHELWQQAGRPEGRDNEFWHQAEKELKATDDVRETANEQPPVLPG